jgi:hypothetical protein
MDRWNWFLSANFSGKWIVTNGYAEVSLVDKKLMAVLRYSPDTAAYAVIEGIADDAGQVKATVKSYDTKTPSYDVKGVINTADNLPEGKVSTIVLTDGHTVIGLAHGARSLEENLA